MKQYLEGNYVRKYSCQYGGNSVALVRLQFLLSVNEN